MREEGGVGEVLQARRVVGHHIERSREEVADMAVPELALVSAREVAQEAGRSVAGHGSFVQAAQGGRVVHARADGGVVQVVGGRHRADLALRSCLLEVAVGHVPFRVFRGRQAGLQVEREGEAPHPSLLGVVEVHAAHAHLRGIRGSRQGRVLFHEFGKVGGPVADARHQGREGVDVVPQVPVYADATIGGSL